MRSDGELLRRYAEDRSEDAFADLVQRHLNLVYSAALRQVNGDAILAEDIAQRVFTDLSRKAASLAARSSLAGWLYTSTHFATANALRAEQRRHQREREAQTMHDLLQDSGHGQDWEQVRPVLDQAMHKLKSADREAILLRFFENRSLADVGARLGLNENAARMRIERALEKLRLLLSRRGITTTAAALSLLLSTHAVTAAPVPMAAAITSTAIASGASSPAGIATLLLMKKLKLIVIASILLLFTGITALVTKPWWSQPKPTRRAAAQALAANASDIAAADSPINGVWNSRGRTYLDLQFDGRGNVTGTVVWWDGPNGNRVPVGAGTFNSNTGALRLEGEGPPLDGGPSRYVIVGTLENDTLSGEYALGPRKGTFAFTR